MYAVSHEDTVGTPSPHINYFFFGSPTDTMNRFPCTCTIFLDGFVRDSTLPTSSYSRVVFDESKGCPLVSSSSLSAARGLSSVHRKIRRKDKFQRDNFEKFVSFHNSNSVATPITFDDRGSLTKYIIH